MEFYNTHVWRAFFKKNTIDKLSEDYCKMFIFRVLIVLIIQGAFQELKLYGSPSQAEVQCVNTFEVSQKFNFL